MTLFELFEAREKKIDIKLPVRNYVAKNAKTSGAGPHTSKKFVRHDKHKKQDEVK